jgi:hypothetical protein
VIFKFWYIVWSITDLLLLLVYENAIPIAPEVISVVFLIIVMAYFTVMFCRPLTEKLMFALCYTGQLCPNYLYRCQIVRQQYLGSSITNVYKLNLGNWHGRNTRKKTLKNIYILLPENGRRLCIRSKLSWCLILYSDYVPRSYLTSTPQ